MYSIFDSLVELFRGKPTQLITQPESPVPVPLPHWYEVVEFEDGSFAFSATNGQSRSYLTSGLRFYCDLDTAARFKSSEEAIMAFRATRIKSVARFTP